MAFAKTLLEKYRAISNIGVTPDMPPGEARDIKMSNSGAITIYFITVPWLVIVLILGQYLTSAIIVGFLALTLLVFFFNKQGRYTFNTLFFYFLLNGYLFLLCVVLGKQFILQYFFLVTAGVAAISFRDDSRWMVIGILMSLFFYHAASLFAEYVKPVYEIGPLGTEYANNLIWYGVYAGIITMGLIARAGTIFVEGRLKEEHEKLAAANQRISSLSDKLKVYLPHQFVDTLKSGERDTEPDYRRRRLTIFFSDVQGFTAWTDKLEPEEVHEVLNQYLSEMSAIAGKHGGTIDKFIGDALMIFFGDPEYTDDKDHALRAVRMAMEMQEKMAELRRGWEDMGYEEPLHIRVGINTGYATVGNFGSGDRLNYTALGSAVNLASRLESACDPDRITISHTTWSLIKDEIDCEPKGQIEVKGFAEPVKIYYVIGDNQTNA